MNRSYSGYIDIIDKVKHIEQVVITDNRCKKVCYFVLELIKFVLSLFIFLSFLLILKLVGIHEHLQFPFFCISNSFFISNIFLHIGQANSITDVSLTISSFSSSVEETTGKDSINLETDVHSIAIKWGRHASPSDNGDKETQETIREMMKN